ncbi:MAG: DoxX family membrane protein [Cyclobacteriaceae bacterium]|jgi:uncharacterized membrane protein YphA (DoxX/SURF4 family)|nr:DoxX family membrane protein [Cyclobacteriaceae bacterium]MDH4294714.1 DoxX family membrane protein [Cyclobacteriaceae bacterium]MDH5247570.1 DoxX family membrane protein [Cyclobacteriaceae bacterium]
MHTTTSSRAVRRWITILRVSIGIIYVWFGILKFFPGVSPAEDLAKDTIQLLTFNFIQPNLALLLLALWETGVGIMMIGGIYTKLALRIVLVHMFCTFTPLLLLSDLSFTSAPIALTLIGQYIIKNIVIVSALFLINASLKQNLLHR